MRHGVRSTLGFRDGTMSISRSYLQVIFVAAAWILAPSAQAGPITWNYSSIFTNAADPSIAYSYVGQVGQGASGLFDLDAQLFGRDSTSAVGSQSIGIGVASRTYYFAGNQQPPTYNRNFKLTLALNDTASGQTGTVAFTGAFVAEGDYLAPMSARYTNSWEQSAVIGGNRYDVSLRYPGLGNFGNFVAEVNVEPVVATPEPPGIWIVLTSVCAVVIVLIVQLLGSALSPSDGLAATLSASYDKLRIRPVS
jgi:hypothetical protein